MTRFANCTKRGWLVSYLSKGKGRWEGTVYGRTCCLLYNFISLTPTNMGGRGFYVSLRVDMAYRNRLVSMRPLPMTADKPVRGALAT